MRLRVASLRRMIKGKLHVEFVRQELTSYSGLEVLRRYLRQRELPSRLRAACAATGGDYVGGRLARLVLALLYVGARRLEHLRYVAGDPLIARFCGLARIPTARTVANWLRQFTSATLARLVQLNHDLVTDAIARLQLPRLTIDVDGTVVRTGATVAWAFRGFNPHHRKDPSYYPLLAHLAQTGHILRCKNRPGNVHDSKQAVAFLREVINGLRARFGRRLPLEFRMDAAFCQPAVLRLLAARGCGYAIKVGYWHWLPLKQLAADRQRWLPVAPEVSGFFHALDIPQWNLRLRVMIYRKHVATRARRISSSTCSPLTTGITSTPPSPRTWPWTCPLCTPSSAAAGRRRRPSRNSRANSRSMSCPPTTTAPTVPGNSSASWPTISPAASSSTPWRRPNRAHANAPMPT